MTGKYLVTGASGFAGRHLLESRAAGTKAIALVRDPDAWAKEPWAAGLADVTPVKGSLSSLDGWADELPPLAGIFHFAALVRHSRIGADEVYETNVEGTLNMVRLAARHDCRVVMLSTSGTVGCFDSPDEKADENAEFCEATVEGWPYYHSKVIAERRARQLADELGVELVFIRPPVLLGPGDHRFRSTSNIIRMLRGRLPFLIMGGMHFIDIRDAMQALWRAMQRTEVRPVYHLAGTSSTIEEFFGMVGEVSGVRAPHRILPYWLAKRIAAADEWLGMKLRGAPLHFFPGPVVVEMARHYWGLESLYAKDELGYESREPLETLHDTVAWLRATHPALRK
ncbi:MAG: NAD-dependent epimerase/dehydratase family protein [Gammaproteobacteria bacterium]|nr:NAD-dependent epimerase/dehydratase family protein [Gammaproteobacteria bacterium]NNF50187.1 NAD-dependent epimerase/dehydratase family protein [Woeseiaceae bacterium]MBT8094490.1 NAD-dependent epimerase/dehydratase family protein [Gammaproteobacteria bacterium]MBT8104478.1 NAD-dependent epimerase/dehydratase family protein [Gammaproteobacteria bacterium]NNK24492.1 NAD-dependent epimerase/dehydratase family protein [Woeseiaceae bacterium]